MRAAQEGRDYRGISHGLRYVGHGRAINNEVYYKGTVSVDFENLTQRVSRRGLGKVLGLFGHGEKTVVTEVVAKIVGEIAGYKNVPIEPAQLPFDTRRVHPARMVVPRKVESIRVYPTIADQTAEARIPVGHMAKGAARRQVHGVVKEARAVVEKHLNTYYGGVFASSTSR